MTNRELRMRYQGFRTYKPVYVVLLTLVELVCIILFAGIIGAVTSYRDYAKDWVKNVQTVRKFLRDRKTVVD